MALALGAGSAQAIPLTFAFTGTVRETILFDEFGNATYDHSHDGEDVGGAIVVETEGLLRDTFTVDFGTFGIAAAISGADLAVLDADTGEVRFAARLDDEVAQLAAADLDGDGVHELAVATGRDLLVLGIPGSEGRAAH
jgi:hypothetical protein